MNITKCNLSNIRKEIVSGKMLPKEKMIRIVKDKNEKIFIDKTYKANGRGAYLLPTLENLQIIERKNLLSRMLKTKKINSEIYNEIRNEISEVWLNGETKTA